jgi:fatty acid desaturase
VTSSSARGHVAAVSGPTGEQTWREHHPTKASLPILGSDVATTSTDEELVSIVTVARPSASTVIGSTAIEEPGAASPAGAPDRAQRHVSSYAALSRRIREEGLLHRRYTYYAIRIAVLVAAFAAVWFVAVLVGDSWWQLGVAALLGGVTAQFGFLGHDAAHRQVFSSHRWNEWAARILSGVFAGLSYGWWITKHNRHHAAPNQEGYDPDIGPGAIAFTPAQVASRQGLAGWFTRRQGWLFFPLLTLEGVNLHAQGILRLLDRTDPVRRRRIEGALVGGRLGGYVLAVFLLLPPGKAAAFVAVQLAVFGVLLGAAFAPNHKGMPIVPATMKLDFLRRQVLMSRNIRGGLLTTFVMGGLNYQVEHHLFPSMPRPNLRRAQALVRAHCAEHGIPYTETGLVESYGIVIRYLNQVGLRARDPFQCPLVTTYRA